MHDYISDVILGSDRFIINDFDNFIAKIDSSTLPLFQNDENFYIEFYFENDVLRWKAYDYENDYDIIGVEFKWGKIVDDNFVM